MNLYERSTGQYKKEFNYKKICGERAFIRFDGVYMDTVVHVNGIKAAEWKYGYTVILCDIQTKMSEPVKSSFSNPRLNVSDTSITLAERCIIFPPASDIEVSCEYRSPNSRWYSGAGIYRNVWFVTRKDVCIAACFRHINNSCGTMYYISTRIRY